VPVTCLSHHKIHHGNTLKDTNGVKVKNLKSKIDRFVFVEPRYIWLREKTDGIFERPLRAMTAQGPRVAMAYSEYLDVPLEFRVSIILIEHRELTFKKIERLLDYGKYKGIGQWRNGGFGAFTWERIKK